MEQATSAERADSAPRIFPLSSYASRTAFEGIFPQHGSDTERLEKSRNFVNHELNVVSKHYEFTNQYYIFMTGNPEYPFPKLKNNEISLGMLFMHNASRIEGQTKKTTLPHINESQLVKYLLQSGFFGYDESNEVPIINYKPIVDNFRIQEPNAYSFVEKVAGSFDVGSVLMWDFLKTAPTLR